MTPLEQKLTEINDRYVVLPAPDGGYSIRDREVQRSIGWCATEQEANTIRNYVVSGEVAQFRHEAEKSI